MKKDNRTKQEKIAAHKRATKRVSRAARTRKNKWVRKDSIQRRKKAEEIAFMRHMARLRGELGNE